MFSYFNDNIGSRIIRTIQFFINVIMHRERSNLNILKKVWCTYKNATCIHTYTQLCIITTDASGYPHNIIMFFITTVANSFFSIFLYVAHSFFIYILISNLYE